MWKLWRKTEKILQKKKSKFRKTDTCLIMVAFETLNVFDKEMSYQIVAQI